MIYLYVYYAVVFTFVVSAIYALITEWKSVNLAGKLVVVTFSLFAASTATIISMLHSWTGEGFGYFSAILRALGVQI